METLLLQKPQWTPYDGDIARRLDLEKVRNQAQLILDWLLTADQTDTIPSPQSLFIIRKKTDEEKKTESPDKVTLGTLKMDAKEKEGILLELAA